MRPHRSVAPNGAQLAADEARQILADAPDLSCRPPATRCIRSPSAAGPLEVEALTGGPSSAGRRAHCVPNAPSIAMLLKLLRRH